MKNYSLQARIIIGFLFVGLLVLIVAIIGWSGNTRLSSNINAITNNAFPGVVNLSKIYQSETVIQASIRSQLIADYTPTMKNEDLGKLKTNLRAVDEAFEKYKKLPMDLEEDKIYQSLIPLIVEWKNSVNEFLRLQAEFLQFNINNPRQAQIDLLNQNRGSSPEFAQAKAAAQSRNQMIAYVIYTERPTYKKLEAPFLKLIEYNANVADREQKDANEAVSQTTFWVILGMIIGPVTAIIFGIYFSNTIAKPMGAKINRVVSVAEKIAKGDLTSPVPTAESADEIGKLQDAFHYMTKNLNSLISQVNQVVIQITKSTTQIAATGKHLEATVTEQAASTNQVSATSHEIAVTSGQLVKTMDNIAQRASITALEASHSQANLMQMEAAMRSLATATTSISSALGVMNEKANNINSVVTTITKVADQTNLLSLNAAIEAEKAGEYGAGFAVVAREIRRLADQTAVATLEIEQMVKQMQSSVSNGVMQMDRFNQQVSSNVDLVSKISGQIATVIEQVQSLTPRFEEVSQSMSQQFEGAQQISTAIAQLSEASQQTVQSLQETNRAVEQLYDAAQGLQGVVSQFKV